MSAFIKGLMGVLLLVAAAVALLDWEAIGARPPIQTLPGEGVKSCGDQEETTAQLRKQLQESQQKNAKLVQQVATIQEEEHQLEQAKDELEEKETELEQQLEEEEQELAQAKQKIQQEEKELAQAQEELELEKAKQRLDAQAKTDDERAQGSITLQQQALNIPDALQNRGRKPANGNLDLAYIAPNGEAAISFSTCAKCGSTSLYLALFNALYGHRWDKQGPPWVQQWTRSWPKQGLPSGSKLVYAGFIEKTEIPWHHYQVVRDPVDRYISAYFSKARCCEPEFPGTVVSSVSRRPVCAKDKNDNFRVTSSILSNNKTPSPNGYAKGSFCLYFEEYAHLLKTASSPVQLNGHVRPQAVQATKRERQVWTGTIAELDTAVDNLVPYGFHKIAIGRTHVTQRGNWTGSVKGMKDLCDMALPEYRQFDLPLSPLCHQAWIKRLL